MVHILSAVGYLVLVIAALTVFLSMYNATVSRQRDIAVMRSVGGSQAEVFSVVIFETLGLTLFGALLGRVFGYSTALVIGSIFTQCSAISLPIQFMASLEPRLFCSRWASA